jgi:hypothetical protein
MNIGHIVTWEKSFFHEDEAIAVKGTLMPLFAAVTSEMSFPLRPAPLSMLVLADMMTVLGMMVE